MKWAEKYQNICVCLDGVYIVVLYTKYLTELNISTFTQRYVIIGRYWTICTTLCLFNWTDLFYLGILSKYKVLLVLLQFSIVQMHPLFLYFNIQPNSCHPSTHCTASFFRIWYWINTSMNGEFSFVKNMRIIVNSFSYQQSYRVPLMVHIDTTWKIHIMLFSNDVFCIFAMFLLSFLIHCDNVAICRRFIWKSQIQLKSPYVAFLFIHLLVLVKIFRFLIIQ